MANKHNNGIGFPLSYEVEGISIYFYYGDHDPVHLHAKYAEYDQKYLLLIDNGKLIAVESLGGYMPPVQDKKIRKFIKKHFNEVLDMWIQVVIKEKKIPPRKIWKI